MFREVSLAEVFVFKTELRTWAADHAEVSAQLNEAREQWKKDTTFLTERAESLKVRKFNQIS